MFLESSVDTLESKQQHNELNNRFAEPSIRRVTLCGSTRFKKAFIEWNRRLTLEGRLVYTVAFWTHANISAPSAEQKEALDLVHFEKIKNSDEIFVVDVGGYVGESTKREIEFAKSLGKKIRRLSEDFPWWDETMCEYVTDREVAGL